MVMAYIVGECWEVRWDKSVAFAAEKKANALFFREHDWGDWGS